MTIERVKPMNPNATAPGIALQHTLYGEHKGGSGGVEHTNGNIQPAGLHSTAPYVPPVRRQDDNPELQLCSHEDCKAFPIKAVPYCAGHARSLGLVNWAKGGRHKSEDAVDDDTGQSETVGMGSDGDNPG